MKYYTKLYLLICFSFSFGQVDTLQSLRFFPLKIGQKWQYQIKFKHYFDGYEFIIRYITVDVLNDTIMPNNKRYFMANNAGILNMGTYLRVDSSDLLIKAYNKNCDEMEDTIFDLSTIGSAPTFCDTTDSTTLFTYTFNSTLNQVGLLNEYKVRIERYMPPIIDDLFMSENFGISSYEWGDRGAHNIYDLSAALIDSNQFGIFVHPRIPFFPITVGNKWEYNTIEWYYGEDTLEYITTSEIIGDTILFGLKWYTFRESSPSARVTRYIRIDSLEGKVYGLVNDNLICPIYDLNLNETGSLADSCFNVHQITNVGYEQYGHLNWYGGETIQYTRSTPFFNKYTSTLCAGIGVTYHKFSPGGVDGFIEKTISAVRINGNELGDFLEIKNEDAILPENYLLGNPYPNPFNAQITFDINITHSTHLKLLVSDLQGKVIKEIINEIVESGSYSYIWNAERNSSGIYFVTAITNGILVTKKAILIK